MQPKRREKEYIHYHYQTWKVIPAFEGLLVQWLLRYIDLVAAGRVSDEGIQE